MKYSVAAVSAFVAVALAKPEFLNSVFEVQEGKPFTLEYSGCSSGCTITLQTGASSNLKDVKVLATSATGSSTTVTLEDLPSGTYNFKITDKSGESNFSSQFPFQGTGVASSSATSATGTKETETASSTTEAATSTTEAVTSTTEAASTTSEESTTTLVKSTTAHSTTKEAASTTTVTTVAHSATHKHNSTTIASTGSASTTTGHHSTAASTSTNPAVTTVAPGSAAGHLSSPLALVAGVALALAFLS
ncbi:hypothetical protein J3F83DRAFT_738038 [Trichoderma novae-zelandiae]